MSSFKIDMSKISLSKEGVVDLAHWVIQTMQCEWEGCTITLNCWDTLAKVINSYLFVLFLWLMAPDLSCGKPLFPPGAIQNPAVFLYA